MHFVDPASFIFVSALVGAVTACLLVAMHAGLERVTGPLVCWVAGDLAFAANRVIMLLQPGTFGSEYAGLAPLHGSVVFMLATPFIVLGITLHSLGLGLMAGRRLSRPSFALALGVLPTAYVVALALLSTPTHRVELLFGTGTLLAALHLVLMKPLLAGSRGAKAMAGVLVLMIVHNLAILAHWTVQPPQMALEQPGVPLFPPTPVLIIDFVASLFMTFSFALIMQERVREYMMVLSTTDQLTGTLNRHGAMPLLGHEWLRAMRYDRPLAVAMLDLDHFKHINDGHGHAAGDAALVAFAQRIASLKRGPDQLARWGGEEFLLVMPETTAAEAAQAVERMRAAVTGTPLAPTLQCTTFSAGVAATQPGARPTDIETLLRQADRRLYIAKATRNRVVADDDRESACAATGSVAAPGPVPAVSNSAATV